MAMTIETLSDTSLSYDNRASADRRCDQLNAARFAENSQFSKHFVVQTRFENYSAYYAIVCVNRVVRP
jgi:hypothetical protein